MLNAEAMITEWGRMSISKDHTKDHTKRLSERRRGLKEFS
jgi:hypothetical protein